MSENNQYNQYPSAEVYLAWQEGKEIEYFFTGKWNDVYKGLFVEFLKYKSIYFGVPLRIKKEKTFRAWKPEEIPVGAMIRNQENKTDKYHLEGLILSRFGAWVWTSLSNSLSKDEKSTEYMFKNNYQYSQDGGKTWQICGVEE